VSVDVVPVTLAGLNAAVTPAGRFSAVRATAPVNPPPLVRVTVAVFVPLCAKDNVVGATASVKLGVGAATIVMVSVLVAAVTPVPVARTVAVMTPGVAVPAAPMVSTADDADAPIVAGANVDVPFAAANPSRVSPTSPVNPPDRVRFTVTVPVVPCVTLRVDDESEMLIAGVG